MTTQTEARELAQRFGVRMCDENEETHDQELYCLGLDDIIDMAKALAQPEQEPAKLWCETCEGTGQVYQEHQAGCHVGGHFECPDCDGQGHIVSRLYSTNPPQRTWVGLTDEELDALTSSLVKGWVVKQIAIAIEAKLKEKNT